MNEDLIYSIAIVLIIILLFYVQNNISFLTIKSTGILLFIFGLMLGKIIQVTHENEQSLLMICQYLIAFVIFRLGLFLNFKKVNHLTINVLKIPFLFLIINLILISLFLKCVTIYYNLEYSFLELFIISLLLNVSSYSLFFFYMTNQKHQEEIFEQSSQMIKIQQILAVFIVSVMSTYLILKQNNNSSDILLLIFSYLAIIIIMSFLILEIIKNTGHKFVVSSIVLTLLFFTFLSHQFYINSMLAPLILAIIVTNYDEKNNQIQKTFNEMNYLLLNVIMLLAGFFLWDYQFHEKSIFVLLILICVKFIFHFISGYVVKKIIDEEKLRMNDFAIFLSLGRLSIIIVLSVSNLFNLSYKNDLIFILITAMFLFELLAEFRIKKYINEKQNFYIQG